ncbi:protein of unknown function [Flagellimonas taeanensis]|uniref:DUF4270 domain-containing protein n=1 Tax=Flagellimonas taeanensis TaxID=1005926 RepID=A0A1M6X127_9FLAO|nr:DUF4270 family protein [Allomuricauda taeanensis]SFB98795.1 protein of unknown function [Allomuricauda taeanensis]SHK99549.1 protein of unknown function [Allomuricauda taeanensis]
MKYKGWFLVSLVLAVISCSTEERDIPTLEVGQEFTDRAVRLIEIDTFDVRTGTFKFDSIITSSKDRLLVGRYIDQFFGAVKSESYMELTAMDYHVPDDAELDSIALILGYDHYFYNDTLQMSHIRVHRILEDFETTEDAFYNTSSLRYDTIPMITKSFYPEPMGEDSLHISIPRSFGADIFELLREKSISGDEDFIEQFKGIVLSPLTNGNSTVIGFSKSTERTMLRFYYSLPEEFDNGDEDDGDDLFLDFVIKQTHSLNAFNRITSDVTGLPLTALIDQETDLFSEDSNDMTFMQSGTGYVTRIEFPTIKNIGDLPGTGTILSAVLEITPLLDSYDDFFPLRDSLQVQVVDQNNEFSSFVKNGNGLVFGRFGGSDQEFNGLVYQIPVTTYIEQELEEAPEIDNALILMPSAFQHSLDRVVLHGSGSKDFEPKLIITYAIYDE